MNSKVFIFLLLGLLLIYSCGKSIKKELKSTSDSTKTQTIDSTAYLNNKVIDSLVLNLDNDSSLESIAIIGIHSDINYKFQVYDDSGLLIGDLFSNNKYPWLDSLEETVGDCKILWGNEYLNGSDCGGDAYYGYTILDNKLEHVISIPDSYYGCYSIMAPKGDPFYWGNIDLTRIKYNCGESIEVTVNLDLNKATSWESMDSTKKTMYDKKHKLTYSWISDQKQYLVKSKTKKDTAYSIETVYDMTEYLEKEFGLKWP